MTPKEKAQDLLNAYSYIEYDQNNGIGIANPTLKEGTKHAAFLCVQELIREHTHAHPIQWNITRKTYWEQVKQELEKL